MIEVINMRAKKNEIFFFVAWFFFLVSILIESTEFFATHNFGMVTKGMRYLSYLICLYIIIENNIKKKDFKVFLFILAIFGISCLASTNKTMVLYLLILFAAFNVDDKKIIKATVWMQGLFLLIVVILSQTGIFHDYIFGVGSDRIRHGLGFGWTTTPPILYFYFLLGLIYLKREKINFLQTMVLEIINIYFYLKTDTKMAFALSTLFLIFFLIQGTHKRRWQFLSKLKNVYLLLPTVFCVVAFLLAIYYSPNNFWNSFNQLLSGRLALAQNAINKYGITLFGQHIHWRGQSVKSPTMGQDYNYVDSSYVQLGLRYGIVFLSLVIGLHTYAIKLAIKRNDYYFIFVMIFNLVLSLTEPRLMNFAFNPFPLVIFSHMGQDVKNRVKMIKVRKVRNITPMQKTVNSDA